jgi:hypothetical protein
MHREQKKEYKTKILLIINQWRCFTHKQLCQVHIRSPVYYIHPSGRGKKRNAIYFIVIIHWKTELNENITVTYEDEKLQEHDEPNKVKEEDYNYIKQNNYTFG